MLAESESFIEYLRFEKRFSPHTVLAYESDLEQFRLYLVSAYSIEKIGQVDHSIIRSWIVQLMDEGIGPRSVNRKITTLKTFYKYLLRQKAVQQNPMLKIQSPKTAKRLPSFVEEAGMDQLLEELTFEEGLEGERDKLILELFYGTGMRLAELINIRPADINLHNMSIKVLGKRNKERIIPIHHTLVDSIKKYSAALEKDGSPKSEYLFSKKGKKLYPRLVYSMVNMYLSKVTTLDKKSPHVLRHTFATHMLNNGAELNAIKELLGHASLSATQVYTHNSIEKLRNVHKKAHPKA
jgi:integrase/recombinase XerC